MDNFQQRAFAFLKALTAKQIVLLAGSAMIVGVTIWVFVRLLGQGDYKILYSGMAPDSAFRSGCQLECPVGNCQQPGEPEHGGIQVAGHAVSGLVLPADWH
jgi:hypothetical protein